MGNEEQQHKRRVRYKGTHPRNFNEKYKELNPEKYGEEVEKIKSKGHTPAGMHISICVKEILEFLDIKQGQNGLDCTLGYGGHTQEMLKCLNGEGHIYALDVDPIESAKTKARLEKLGFDEKILTIVNTNFKNIDKVSATAGKFNFVLADLGISSMQVDNPERGFSFKAEGALDLRMNPLQGITAAERLKKISQPELEGMLIENSDEPYARQISAEIIAKRRKHFPIETTTQLYDIIAEALKFLPAATRADTVKKSCARVFQALRIDINNEFESLYALLDKLPDVLESGGRVAILTFHSGEDRLVKKSFKAFKREGIYSEIADNVILPSAEECAKNSRAHSAKLRWAVRA